LRRLARQERQSRAERDRADAWADRLIGQARDRASLVVSVLAELAQRHEPLSDGFVVQLVHRLRDCDAPVAQAFAWLDDRLAENDLSVVEAIQRERHRQSVNQVSVGNCITGMRFIGALDWPTFFEAVSLVERELRRDPAGAYHAMD